ncbi:MAG: hypothetical protein V1874_00500 [Spirochaetota bacterium]
MKKIFIKLLIVLIAILILLALPFAVSMTSDHVVLITNTNSKYYTAKHLLVIGEYAFCRKDSIEYTKRKEALAGIEHKYAYSFIPLREIAYMEIIPSGDNNGNVTGGTFESRYLGKYKIDVSGNVGYLYLGIKNGKVTGSVRFPDWANGSFEPLKNPWINKGKIGFIRSVETLEELKKVGSHGYFTQEFHGEYKENGNVIHGYYLNRGANMMWRAFKLK